jgi:hypothetical protein
MESEKEKRRDKVIEEKRDIGSQFEDIQLGKLAFGQ